MRQIKFRAKSLKNNDWIVGSYVHDEEWAKDYIYRLQHTGIYYQLVSHEVKFETLGEFSGLHDKNGKEIWEGDIVKSGNNIGKVTSCAIVR